MSPMSDSLDNGNYAFGLTSGYGTLDALDDFEARLIEWFALNYGVLVPSPLDLYLISGPDRTPREAF